MPEYRNTHKKIRAPKHETLTEIKEETNGNTIIQDRGPQSLGHGLVAIHGLLGTGPYCRK